MASAAEMDSYGDVILERGLENYPSTVLVICITIFALYF